MTGAAQTQRKLLTVITEANLELDALGVGGYTITDARGRGEQEARRSSWGHTGNIRVEVVCDTPLAEHLLGRLRDKYYEHYSIVMWVQDVEVLRPGKFR